MSPTKTRLQNLGAMKQATADGYGNETKSDWMTCKA